MPSPELLYRSNFTATLEPMPWYPRPIPFMPTAFTPPAAFCSAKVKPSAVAEVSWKSKSVVKLCTLTGVVYHTAFACTPPAAVVSCSAVPVSVAPPTKLRPAVLVKPVGSLMTGVPLVMV